MSIEDRTRILELESEANQLRRTLLDAPTPNLAAAIPRLYREWFHGLRAKVLKPSEESGWRLQAGRYSYSYDSGEWTEGAR